MSFSCYLHHQFFNRLRLRAGHYKIPAQQQAPTLVAMFRPQRVGLTTIVDLYLLISTGSALQNVKQLHVVIILVGV